MQENLHTLLKDFTNNAILVIRAIYTRKIRRGLNKTGIRAAHWVAIHTRRVASRQIDEKDRGV